MLINKYETKNYWRYKTLDGKTLYFECKTCHHKTKKYRGIYSHVKIKHSKKEILTNQQPSSELKTKLPIEPKNTPLKPPQVQPCPYCGQLLTVPIKAYSIKCINPDCIEEIRIIDGRLKKWETGPFYKLNNTLKFFKKL